MESFGSKINILIDKPAPRGPQIVIGCVEDSPAYASLESLDVKKPKHKKKRLARQQSKSTKNIDSALGMSKEALIKISGSSK